MTEFSFEITDPITDPYNDNVDVKVTLANGDCYFPTFFTLENLNSLMKKWEEDGECNNGEYCWSSDMIIVREINSTVIRNTLRDLIENGDLDSAVQTKVCGGPTQL